MNDEEKVEQDMYHFLLSELEFQSKQQTMRALFFGAIGGVIGFCICIILNWLFSSPVQPKGHAIEPKGIAYSQDIVI
jgi:hypothetical protein